MPTKITGSFSFSKTDYNNLLGEFLCIGTNDVSIEAAKRIKQEGEEGNSFDGTYKSIWLDTRHHIAVLVISLVSGNTFKLTWSINKKPVYEGEGFISDNKLVGSYWQL